MKSNLLSVFTVLASLLPATGWAADSAAPATRPADGAGTIVLAYPGLASGALTHARIADLPAGTLVKSGELAISSQQLDGEIAKAPESVQGQLKKNGFYLAEQIATGQLLLREAKAVNSAANADERAQIRSLLEPIASKVSVSDEQVMAFYAQNKDMFEGADPSSAKAYAKEMLLQQKQQDAVNEYIRTLGQRVAIEVSSAWAKEQAALAQDNPVAKARASGKPSVVDFGAKGCIPCDKLAPILETLRGEYEGRANVLFVSVREEQVLAARYGIQSIPVQIFFDKNGNEVFRHTGFYPQDQIEKRMADMGVK